VYKTVETEVEALRLVVGREGKGFVDNIREKKEKAAQKAANSMI